jgi:hypothetical protein
MSDSFAGRVLPSLRGTPFQLDYSLVGLEESAPPYNCAQPHYLPDDENAP